MLTWTIEQYHKKGRRREITVYLEGELTFRDCAGIYKLCIDNYSRSDKLVLDLAQTEERDVSMSVLTCCLRKTACLAAGRISLRGIPARLPGPATDFKGVAEGAACVFHDDCHCSVSRLVYGAPPVGP